MSATPARPRPRIPPAALPATIRWRLWRRAREHAARDALLRLVRAAFQNRRAPSSAPVASPRRILLIRTGRAIGDMTMALSLAAACRRHLTEAQIACVMRETLIPFFRNCPDLDALHVLPRRIFFRPAAALRLWRALRREWEIVLAMDAPGKTSFTTLCFCLIARARRRAGFETEENRGFLTDAVAAPPNEPMRASLQRLAACLLPQATAARPLPLPRLVPDAAARAAAERLLGPEMPPVIVFVSEHWSKSWPLAAWCRVAAQLTTAGHRTWLAFGPGDARVEDPALHAWAEKSRGLGAVLPAQPPAVWLALLARCRLYLSNDCGPYHLAVAAGARCVGVFSTPEALRDFGYEEPGRLVALHEPDLATAEARALAAALGLLDARG